MDSVDLKKQPKDVTECPYAVDASLFKSETSEVGHGQTVSDILCCCILIIFQSKFCGEIGFESHRTVVRTWS